MLSLRTGEALLQALESRDLGRPLALSAVVVGNIDYVGYSTEAWGSNVVE